MVHPPHPLSPLIHTTKDFEFLNFNFTFLQTPYHTPQRLSLEESESSLLRFIQQS